MYLTTVAKMLSNMVYYTMASLNDSTQLSVPCLYRISSLNWSVLAKKFIWFTWGFLVAVVIISDRLLYWYFYKWYPRYIAYSCKKIDVFFFMCGEGYCACFRNYWAIDSYHTVCSENHLQNEQLLEASVCINNQLTISAFNKALAT